MLNIIAKIGLFFKSPDSRRVAEQQQEDTSTPSPQVQVWRPLPEGVNWDNEGYKALIKLMSSTFERIMQRNKSEKKLRILLLGENGHGKSSFINTLNAAVTRKYSQIATAARTGKHVTQGYYEYLIERDSIDISGDKDGDEIKFPFVICDFRGFGEGTEGTSVENVREAFLGHYKSGCLIEPGLKEVEKKDDSSADVTADAKKADMIIFVVSANAAKNLKPQTSLGAESSTTKSGDGENDEGFLERIRESQDLANKHNVPWAVVLSKVDMLNDTITQDLTQVYKDADVEKAVLDAAGNIGIETNRIFPVKNFTEELEVSPPLAVHALLPIHYLAMDIEGKLKLAKQV